MDFARQQRDPTRHLIGIAFVVLVHGLVIWALLSGLGKTVVEVIKKPLTATIVDQIKPPPPPPPPPKKIVELPKQVPVETYVPPPDIPVVAAPTAPVISAVTPTAPTEPHVITPPPPPVVQAPPPPPPPKPAIRKGIVPVSKEEIEFPRAAIRAGVERGRVVARAMIDEKGAVYEVIIVSADPPRYFEREVIDKLKQWKFKAEGEKYVGEIEINFSLKD